MLKVRSYLTGKDKRDYRKVLVDLNRDGKAGTAEALDAAENLMIVSIVKEIEGSTENIVDRVIAMPAPDYDLVLEQVAEVFNGLDKKKETTSDTSTKTSDKDEQ